jgi:serine/threonine protein kinase
MEQGGMNRETDPPDPRPRGDAGGGADAPVGVAVAAALRPGLEVLRRLGSGSTADVYLAREPELQRLVAVKVLRAELAADDTIRRRFEREAQSAARITHPHVTTVHRIGRLDGGVPYIVMEYIDGRRLADVIEATGALPLVEARATLAAVAAALAAAHEKGIVHRDVRPDNVYIENRTGRAVLGDFGIAAMLESGSAAVTRLTAAGVRLGQTRYLSPEQLRDEGATEQSDIYAFGILAYEVLSGRGPYEARTDAQYLAAHLTQTPRPLQDLRPDIEPGLAALIQRCLAKDPQRRPRATDLVKRLAPPTGAVFLDVPERGRVMQFLRELRRRRVYQVFIAYGAFATALLGAAQPIYDAFSLSRTTYQVIVLVTLAGMPASLVLAWIYDISFSGIERTHAEAGTGRLRPLLWIGLGATVLVVGIVGWLLLR